MSVVGVAPIAGEATGFFDIVTGSNITFSQSGLRPGGGDTLIDCNGTLATQRFGCNFQSVTPNQVACSFWFQFVALPGSTTNNLFTGNVLAGTGFQFSLNGSTNKLSAQAGGGTAQTGPTISANTWYLVDMLMDCSTGTSSLQWWINGVAQTTATGSQTATTMTGLQWGWQTTASSAHVQFMDIVWSYTAADAPLGSYITKLAPLTGCGTHSLGVGVFKKTGAVVIIVGETTSYQEIDEFPPSNTDYVDQTVIDATHYVEYTVTALAAPPSAVNAIAGFQGSATGAYAMEVRLWDGTTEGSDVTSAATKSGTTARFSTKHLAANPSGGAWGTGLARMRFGYSSDVSPNPMLNAMGLVYAYPQPSSGSITVAGVI